MQAIKRIDRRSLFKMMVAGVANFPLLQGSPVWAWNGEKAAHTNAQQAARTRNSACILLDKRSSRELLSRSQVGELEGINRYKSSGNARFDRALGMMLADLAGRFKVRPGFGFYDDEGSPGALATPVSQFPNSRGTVVIGLAMIEKGLREEHGDMFVMGICSHEFGHIVQFFSSYRKRLTDSQSTNKVVELHADFLSGYYIGLRNVNYSSKELVYLGRSWKKLGDSDYTNKDHHGTEAERLRAIEAGFKFARERPEFEIKDACEVGARYLQA